MQIDHVLSEKDDEIDREQIRSFLDKLSYPLYFLDLKPSNQRFLVI